jgi:hypothetical protein
MTETLTQTKRDALINELVEAGLPRDEIVTCSIKILRKLVECKRKP